MAASFTPPSSTSLLRRRPSRLCSGNHAPFSRIKASWQEVAGVMVLSAIPFTAVKAIANSPLGEALQRQMEQKKKLYAENSSKFKALAEKAREESLWFGEDRPRWLGPISYKYPAHLTGELPGDYGFDIASLSQDPVALQKYFKRVPAALCMYKCFEVLHARWAMLAALGVVIPEILELLGVSHFVEPVWWRVGYSKLKGDTLDYLGIPGLHVAGSQGVIIIAICQALLMFFVLDRMCNTCQPTRFEIEVMDKLFFCCVFFPPGAQVGPEYARYCGIQALEPLGIYLPGDINYPGGILFDPLNISKDPVAFEELKVKEIKNGRLAMVAWLGFYAQAAVTGKGPVQNLLDHISDPYQNNLISTLKSLVT